MLRAVSVLFALGLAGLASQAASAKPCPARVRVAANGMFYLDHAGVWFKQSPSKVQLFIAGGCYPEGGPSPTSSVTVQIAPHAPESRVTLLYQVLAKTGWPKDRVSIEPWKDRR